MGVCLPIGTGVIIRTNTVFFLFIPSHMIVAGYYGFALDVPVSVHPSIRPSMHQLCVCPSIFPFRMITWVNINGFSPNLVCVLILWRSGLGLLMGKFCQILTEISARDTPIFLFPDDNLGKHQQSYLPETLPYFHFWTITSKCQGILTKLDTCINMKEI